MTGLSGYGSESNESDDEERVGLTLQKDNLNDDQEVIADERRNTIKAKESQNVLSDTKTNEPKSNVE